MERKERNVRVTGLEHFGLNLVSFSRLGRRRVLAYVNLRTYAVTAAVQRLSASKRIAYVTARVDRWIDRLHRLYPKLSFRVKGIGSLGNGARRWSQLPTTLLVRAIPRDVLSLADTPGVSSIHIAEVARRRARSPASPSAWYCVRAFVVIRVECAKGGLQNTEDRFVLVRAASCKDAIKRLERQWRDYSRPYLNSDGRMVSWQLDHIVDVYETCETDIDPAGTEVYSKLAHRRMRPKYVWRPKSFVNSR